MVIVSNLHQLREGCKQDETPNVHYKRWHSWRKMATTSGAQTHSWSEYLRDSLATPTGTHRANLNVLAYNVGYHNEHHDFPSVPWTRLPALRKMAPEFYDVLPHHTSWPMVTLQFILGEDSGLFARIKRLGKGHSNSSNDTGNGEGNALE